MLDQENQMAKSYDVFQKHYEKWNDVCLECDPKASHGVGSEERVGCT